MEQWFRRDTWTAAPGQESRTSGLWGSTPCTAQNPPPKFLIAACLSWYGPEGAITYFEDVLYEGKTPIATGSGQGDLDCVPAPKSSVPIEDWYSFIQGGEVTLVLVHHYNPGHVVEPVWKIAGCNKDKKSERSDGCIIPLRKGVVGTGLRVQR